MTTMTEPTTAAVGEHVEIPIDLIRPNPLNIRRDGPGDVSDLTDSIRAVGILQPLIVVPAPTEPGQVICPACRSVVPAEDTATVPEHKRSPRARATCPGSGQQPGSVGYDLLAGERRYTAARLAGLATVPGIIRPDLTTKADLIVGMYVENAHRLALSPIEEAAAFSQLRLEGLSEKDIAARVGRQRRVVHERIKLTKLSSPLQDKIHHRQITLDEAAALGEFDGDAERSARLEDALGTPDFAFLVQRERAARDLDRARARAIRELEAQGVPLISDQEWHRVCRQRLDLLDVDTEAHADCEGRAAFLPPGSAEIDWFCLQPWKHRPDLFTDPEAAATAADHDLDQDLEDASPDADLDPDAEQRRAEALAEAEQAEAARQERAQQAAIQAAEREQAAAATRAFTADCEAAAAVRWAFVRTLCSGAKPLSLPQRDLIGRAVLTQCLGEGLYDVDRDRWLAWLDGHMSLDTEVPEIDPSDAELHLDRMIHDRDPGRVMLAMLAVEAEDRLNQGWSWQPWTLEKFLYWLDLLVELGHELSSWETEQIQLARNDDVDTVPADQDATPGSAGGHETDEGEAEASEAGSPGEDGGGIKDADQTDGLGEPVGVCGQCFCTNDDPCPGGCGWVDVDQTLCSRCDSPVIDDVQLPDSA